MELIFGALIFASGLVFGLLLKPESAPKTKFETTVISPLLKKVSHKVAPKYQSDFKAWAKENEKNT